MIGPAWPGVSPVVLLCKVSAVLLTALSITRGLRRSSAGTRHLVLTSAFMLVLFLPLVSVTLPALELPWLRAEPPTPFVPLASSATVDILARGARPEPRPAVEPAATTGGPVATSWRLRALISYGAIVALLLVRLIVGVTRLAGISRRARRVDDDPAWAGLLASEASRRVRVALTPEVPVPLTWGARRPEILLPDRSARWTRDERQRALQHELAHVERADWLVQCASRVCCALYWFHPLVWLAARRHCLEAELAADDRVLLTGAAPDAYADQLLELARGLGGPGPQAFVAPTMARRHQLWIRIDRILNHRPRRSTMSRTRILSVSLCSLLALITLGAARLVPAASTAQAAAPAASAATARDEGRSTPLIVAASRGDLAAVQRLLDAGADPNEYDNAPVRRFEMMRSPLATAARQGHLRIVETLLDAGALIDAAPPGDATALMEAAGQGHRDVVELLLARGADVNAVVRGDGTPLIAAARGGHGDIVDRLLAAGADPNVAVRGDGSPLINAAGSADAATIGRLLDAGVDVNAEIPGDGNALIVAAREGDDELVRMLIDAGADVDAAVPGDGNALIMAAAAGHLDVVELLLDRGAEIDRAVPGDENALIRASEGGHYDVVRALLDRGADVNARVRANGEIRTPLLMATRRGQDDVAELLRSRGAVE